jgi:glutamyl/glutaminyl-tRNA synthetase
MKISHIIRGEEHISNTPRQILLQEALGLPQLQYAHIPMILSSERSKLSKRHGATAVLDYQKEGYLPEAIVNFIAFLGWNPGTEREIYSLASLAKEFSLDKIQKAGAVFNIKRLDYLNGFYIRHRSIEKLTELCIPYLIEAGLIESSFEEKQYPPAYGAKEFVPKYKISETGKEINFEFLKNVTLLYQERLKILSEITEFTDFFFKSDLEYDKGLLKWKEMSESEIFEFLDKAGKLLSEIKPEDWIMENLTNLLMPEAERAGDRGKLLWPLRASLTGKQASAGPFEIMELLGKEETLKRIEKAKELLK